MAAPSLDLVVSGGRVIDGTGSPWFHADIAVANGAIAAVGRLGAVRAKRRINADGLVVCPGFIDMHAHSDLQLLANPGHEAKVHQGVTLDVIGQDGLSYAPVNDDILTHLRSQLAAWNDDPVGFDWNWSSVGEYLDRLDASGAAVSAAYLAPHGTIRACVLGFEDRSPTTAEIELMKSLLRAAFDEGAVGLSSGLTYAPGMFATDEELVALCAEMQPYAGFYCPHHRNYGTLAIESYRDCIEIVRKAGVPLHLPHANLSFEINRGRAGELIQMIDGARSEGIEVTLDSYPYLAGATYLHAFLPRWAQVGEVHEIVGRLRDERLRERLRVELEIEGSDGFHGVPMDWGAIVISDVRSEQSKRWVGTTIAEAATVLECREIDFYCDLLATEELAVGCVAHIGNEENVQEILVHPAHMVGSDGVLVGEQPHPRAYGTFPRFLATYVREKGLLRWEEAIRKMTSLPAQRLRFWDRGIIRPGFVADLVCFDPLTVRDTSTYDAPRQFPEGIPYVVVNGEVVVDDGRHTGRLPGRAVRRQGASA